MTPAATLSPSDSWMDNCITCRFYRVMPTLGPNQGVGQCTNLFLLAAHNRNPEVFQASVATGYFWCPKYVRDAGWEAAP